MDRDLVKLSRFLSRVLRHDPGRIGLTLDAQGWADVDLLIGLAQAAGQPIDLARVLEIVAQNDKQRFALRARPHIFDSISTPWQFGGASIGSGP